MRKIRFKPVAAIAAALAPLMAAAGVINYTATYDYSKLTLGTDTLGGVTYTTVSYDGLYNGGDPGMPSLPVDYLKFSVPYNATNFRVTATMGDSVTAAIGHLVYPCQIPRMMTDINPRPITQPDNSAYFTNASYPSQCAWVEDDGFFAGENHIVTVAVMPVTYRHVSDPNPTDSIRSYRYVNLALEYDLDNTHVSSPIIRRDSSLRNEAYQLVQSIVFNPGDVSSNATPQNSQINGPWSSYYPGIIDTTGVEIDTVAVYPYLIVTTQALYKAMRRIAALKRQKGFNVKMVTMDDVLDDDFASTGDVFIYRDGTKVTSYTDNAGKLRQYLKLHFCCYSTQYVLLAGSGVPYRTAYGRHGDMYYGGITTNWNDMVDGYAELYVGRLLGTDSIRFDYYTDKLFRYELNPGNGDYSYLRKALLTEAEPYETLSGSLIGICPERTVITENVDDPLATGCDVLDSISTNHYGFISTYCDGYPTYIKLNGPDGDNVSHYIWALDTVKTSSVIDSETGNGLNRMVNKEYPMIYFCPNGVTMPYGTTDVTYGESFTMGKDYGGPAYLGYTGNAEYDPTRMFASSFGYHMQGTGRILGKAVAMAKMYSGDSWEKVYDNMNILGDPSLSMWNGNLQQYTGISVTRADSSITVSGISSTPAFIGYHSNDGKTGLVKATSSYLALSGVSPNSTIMLHYQDHIPYIAPLVLQNTTLNKSQYVIASDVTAGKSVDSGRTSGQVTFTGNIDYEIEHTGDVRFEGGFKVEKGVRFSVRPSTYNK